VNSKVPAPEMQIDYLPKRPKSYAPGIGLIGCGAITKEHLEAYKAAGFRIVGLCDIDIEKAKARQSAYFPKAKVYTDFQDLLRNDEIEVVDIATHTDERPPLIEASLKAKRHVLSQKPFVVNLDKGEALCDLADKMGVQLAVNQNGRWAPHFCYMRKSIQQGLIGDLMSVVTHARFDHSWTKGTNFEYMRDLILFDYAIHWFDFLVTVMPSKAKCVYAFDFAAKQQPINPPMLGSALIEFPDGHASLIFDGFTKFLQEDRTTAIGSKGTVESSGRDHSHQKVTIETERGQFVPELKGKSMHAVIWIAYRSAFPLLPVPVFASQ
jgi:predicted dehydrogenase